MVDTKVVEVVEVETFKVEALIKPKVHKIGLKIKMLEIKIKMSHS